MNAPIPPHRPAPKTAAAPEHRWISDGSTLNPAPGHLQKLRRDTAEGCRERASATLLESLTAHGSAARRLLEQSAASWTLRADHLQDADLRTPFKALIDRAILTETAAIEPSQEER